MTEDALVRAVAQRERHLAMLEAITADQPEFYKTVETLGFFLKIDDDLVSEHRDTAVEAEVPS